MWWRNSRTGTLYSEVTYRGGVRSLARSVRTRKLSTVRNDHLVPVTEEELFDPEQYEDSLADAIELEGVPENHGQTETAPLPLVPLPAMHAQIRHLPYTVGVAASLLMEQQWHWPKRTVVQNLRVVRRLVDDELERLGEVDDDA